MPLVFAAGGLGCPAGRHLAEAASLGQAYALLLFRSGRLREAQDRYESAGDFAAAAAVAKCRVLGEDALRLELAEAETSSGRRAALALIRAAELVTRFAGMFTTPMPDPRAEAWLDQARAAERRRERQLATRMMAQPRPPDDEQDGRRDRDA